MTLDISANISSIAYTPYLCADLHKFEISDLREHFPKSAFILRRSDLDSVALSWWVSAKRTRSYPYARVYDTLGFSGKKITVIPIFKDEGYRGDRDFLQWDTISLMSLLGVHVIIGYYADAVESSSYPGQKITSQRFDMEYIRNKIEEIFSHHSGALHWNLNHARNAGDIGAQAIDCYDRISTTLNVRMHSLDSAHDRIKKLQQGRDEFMAISRALARAAQLREAVTIQPKEQVEGEKGNITVHNFLGGSYFLTLDEVEITKENISLIEAKHSRSGMLPSTGDIKDALIKMYLFTNLEDVKVNGQSYIPQPIMKLTGGRRFDPDKLNKSQQKFWQVLIESEAKLNGFGVRTT